MGQKAHIQYAMKSNWYSWKHVCLSLLSESERHVKITGALHTSHFCSFRFQLKLWAHRQHQFLWFRTVWMSVSERLLVHRHKCFRWMDVDHVCSLWTTDDPAGIVCVHIKNTIISERNDKSSCISLLHSHFVPICFNATIYEPLSSCTIFKTFTVFFPFFSSE